MLPIIVFLLYVSSGYLQRKTCSHHHFENRNGLACKEIAANNIAPERTIKNFMGRGSTAVKKSSGHHRVSSKYQDCLLMKSQLWNRVTTSAELAQYWSASASAHTVRRTLLDNGLMTRRAAKKQLLSKENIKEMQEVQGLNSRVKVQRYFLWYHKARAIMKWLRGFYFEILESWPGSSLDFNHIDSAW